MEVALCHIQSVAVHGPTGNCYIDNVADRVRFTLVPVTREPGADWDPIVAAVQAAVADL